MGAICMENNFEQYLLPTAIIDSDNQAVRDYAMTAVKGAADDHIEKAVKLYYAVRDGIWYNPYLPFYRPEHYRASNVIKSGHVKFEPPGGIENTSWIFHLEDAVQYFVE